MIDRIFKSKKSKLCTILFIVISLLSYSKTINAASLTLQPSSIKVGNGGTITVKLVVSTDGKAINNSDGVISYPTEYLDLVSISKTSSIFSLWVEEPRGGAGIINYDGGVPSPGYTGSAGELLRLTFRAKKIGTASINIREAAVRQNDGFGTDILTAKVGASVQIVEAVDQPLIVTPPAVADSAPGLPVIVSNTNPRQEEWYSNKVSSFSWTVPSGVTAIQTSYNTQPSSIPSVNYDVSVTQRTITNSNDGIYYFHLRYKNDAGYGPTAHYKVQVDSTPPNKFSIVTEDTKPFKTLTLNANDSLSGISYYLVKIGDDEAIKVVDDGSHKFALVTQKAGEHTLKVTAVDKAGNQTESSSVFSSSEVVKPIISVVPEKVGINQTVTVNGELGYPLTNVEVTIKFDGLAKIYKAVSSDTGSFSIVSDPFEIGGNAEITAQTLFINDYKGPISNKVKVTVVDTAIKEVARDITYIVGILLPVILLLLALIFVLYEGWHKYFGLRRRINKELKMTVNEVHDSLMSMKRALNKQLIALEKMKGDRKLNEEEETLFMNLQKNIDSIDRFIKLKLKNLK